MSNPIDRYFSIKDVIKEPKVSNPNLVWIPHLHPCRVNTSVARICRFQAT